MEEDYIFPLFEKHKKNLHLIKALKEQHIKGREITADLKEIATSDTIDHAKKITIKKLLHEFVEMYRPHEAREDTEIFPEVNIPGKVYTFYHLTCNKIKVTFHSIPAATIQQFKFPCYGINYYICKL